MARSVALCALAAAVLAACTEPVVPRAAPLTADAPALGKSGTGINFTIRDLGTLGGQSSESYDVNNAKQVVGWSHISNGYRHAFVWTQADGMRDLGTLTGGLESQAYGINETGVVAGWSTINGGTLGSGERRAVRWVRQADGTWLAQDLGKLSPAGTLTEAHAVNDSGDVVGYSAMYYPQPYNGYEAFIWWAAKMDTLEYGRPSYAVAVSNQTATSPKLVVGWACTQTQQACDATVPNHAWVWEKTAAGWTPHDLMTLGGSESQAHGVNDKGQVVGLSRIASGEIRAFVWTQASGMLNLGTLPNGNRSEAYDINEGEAIAGWSYVNFVRYGVLWTKGVTGSWTPQQLAGLPINGGTVGDSYAYAVNDNSPRQVAGASRPDRSGAYHAVLWTVP